jgi:uncharacterized protein with HXXEE motif
MPKLFAPMRIYATEGGQTVDWNAITGLLHAMPLAQAVWLFPIATGLHFLEEAPGFASWARRHTLRKYSQARWAKIHGAGMAFAIVFSALVSRFPVRFVAFLFFALCFSESLWNAVFHLGATLWSRDYCAGIVTALLLYPPLFWLLSSAGLRDGLLTRGGLLAAVFIAGVVHAIDVASTVFGLHLGAAPLNPTALRTR